MKSIGSWLKKARVLMPGTAEKRWRNAKLAKGFAEKRQKPSPKYRYSRPAIATVTVRRLRRASARMTTGTGDRPPEADQ